MLRTSQPFSTWKSWAIDTSSLDWAVTNTSDVLEGHLMVKNMCNVKPAIRLELREARLKSWKSGFCDHLPDFKGQTVIWAFALLSFDHKN